jgi:hypothetical protein
LISQYVEPCVGASWSSDPTPGAVLLLLESLQDQEHGAPNSYCIKDIYRYVYTAGLYGGFAELKRL